MNNFIDFNLMLKKIDFVNRYRVICEKFNCFDNRLRGSNKNVFWGIVKKYDEKSKYIAKERMFMSEYKLDDVSIKIGFELKEGLAQTFLFCIKDEDWLLYGRFDEIAEQLVPGFRGKFSFPIYASYEELDLIVRDIFLIYTDIKNEAASVLGGQRLS